jgi:hypothetical protein
MALTAVLPLDICYVHVHMHVHMHVHVHAQSALLRKVLTHMRRTRARQIAEATTARLAPFCSGLHGRSDAFDLYELEKEAISQVLN